MPMNDIAPATMSTSQLRPYWMDNRITDKVLATAATRAVFVLDNEGPIRYMWVSEDPTKEPNYEEVKQAVQQIN